MMDGFGVQSRCPNLFMKQFMFFGSIWLNSFNVFITVHCINKCKTFKDLELPCFMLADCVSSKAKTLAGPRSGHRHRSGKSDLCISTINIPGGPFC